MDAYLAVMRLLPFVGAVGLVALLTLGVRRYRRDKDRRLGLFALATEQGWDYHGMDPFGLEQRWPCRPFGIGERQRAAQVVTGAVRGRKFIAFDYSFVVETGAEDRGDTTTMQYRVTAVPMPAALPELEITHEGATGLIRSALRPDDIELESEDFNRRFRVRCAEPKLAFDVLPPRSMEALLRSGITGTVRVCGTDVLAIDRGTHTTTTLKQNLDALTALVDGVPGFVWASRR